MFEAKRHTDVLERVLKLTNTQNLTSLLKFHFKAPKCTTDIK